MRVTIFDSASIAQQSRSREGGLKLREIGQRVRTNIDKIVEYPGSRKGDFGEWRLTDWMGAKIEQILSRGGTERK